MYINSLNGEYKFFIFPIKRINIHLKMQQIHYNILITVAIFSSLEGNFADVSKILPSGN